MESFTADSVQEIEFPQSLKDYVVNSFRNCPRDKIPAVTSELRDIVTQAVEQGETHIIDWDRFPLPSSCGGVSNPNSKASKQATPSEQADRSAHKRDCLALDIDMTRDSWSLESPPPKRRRLAKPSRSKVAPAVQSLQRSRSSTVAIQSMLEVQPDEPETPEKRAQALRYQIVELLAREWSDYGELYARCRPIVEETLALKIENSCAVEIYESYVNVALLNEDFQESRKFLDRLLQMYIMGIPGRCFEFLFYHQIFLLFKRDAIGYAHSISLYEYFKEEGIYTIKSYAKVYRRRANELSEAIISGNFKQLVRVYRSIAPKAHCGGIIADHFMKRERVNALWTLCKSHLQGISLDYVVKQLGFQSYLEFMEFLAEQGIQMPVENGLLCCRELIPALVECNSKLKNTEFESLV